MADDPFCYHLKSALAHLRAAINQLNVAFAMQSFKLMHSHDRSRLQNARNTLSRKATAINLLLPLAVDATYIQGKLPDNVLDAIKNAQQLIEIAKSDNAEPPGPK